MKDVLKPIIDAAKNDDMHRVIELAEKQLDKFCDNNCVWTDHHPDCIRAEPKREQGAEKQEPEGEVITQGVIRWRDVYPSVGTKLYTHPQPKREPLTDEQVEKIIKSNMSLQMNLAGIRQDFEAAHGIKGEA